MNHMNFHMLEENGGKKIVIRENYADLLKEI